MSTQIAELVLWPVAVCLAVLTLVVHTLPLGKWRWPASLVCLVLALVLPSLPWLAP